MNDSKEHIITVACKLFLQRSFKEVTMKEIVVKTGLSKGAFYHYFKSKEQLFLEVLDFFFTNVMSHTYANYSRESFHKFYHDYARQANSLKKDYMAKFRDDENDHEFSLNYFTMAFDALKLIPEFREKMITGMQKELEIWTEIIKNARLKGELNSTMTDNEIAQIYVYLGDGVMMHTIMQGSVIQDEVTPFLILWDKLYEQIKS